MNFDENGHALKAEKQYPGCHKKIQNGGMVAMKVQRTQKWTEIKITHWELDGVQKATDQAPVLAYVTEMYAEFPLTIKIKEKGGSKQELRKNLKNCRIIVGIIDYFHHEM